MPELVAPSPPASPRPLFELRRRPGRVALLLFRMPLQAYHHGKGWLLGNTFLLLTHIGRKSRLPHESALMVLRYRREPLEAVVCSAWGADSDWLKNIQAHPPIPVDIGHESFEPDSRFLSAEESRDVIDQCVQQHPWRFRFIGWVFGWGDLRSEPVAREFVRTRPFVAFGPVNAPGEG